MPWQSQPIIKISIWFLVNLFTYTVIILLFINKVKPTHCFFIIKKRKYKSISKGTHIICGDVIPFSVILNIAFIKRE